MVQVIKVGDIVREVNYIAYFNSPRMPRTGIVLKIYKTKSNPSIDYTHDIAKVYWLKSKKFESIPVYLLTHYGQENEYECEKI